MYDFLAQLLYRHRGVRAVQCRVKNPLADKQSSSNDIGKSYLLGAEPLILRHSWPVQNRPYFKPVCSISSDCPFGVLFERIATENTRRYESIRITGQPHLHVLPLDNLHMGSIFRPNGGLTQCIMQGV